MQGSELGAGCCVVTSGGACGDRVVQRLLPHPLVRAERPHVRSVQGRRRRLPPAGRECRGEGGGCLLFSVGSAAPRLAARVSRLTSGHRGERAGKSADRSRGRKRYLQVSSQTLLVGTEGLSGFQNHFGEQRREVVRRPLLNDPLPFARRPAGWPCRVHPRSVRVSSSQSTFVRPFGASGSCMGTSRSGTSPGGSRPRGACCAASARFLLASSLWCLSRFSWSVSFTMERHASNDGRGRGASPPRSRPGRGRGRGSGTGAGSPRGA